MISDAQIRRMYTISGSNNELCKDVLNEFGYKSSKEVPVADYEKIIKVVEETKKKLERIK